MNLESFIAPLIGGLLIGLSATLMLAFGGRVLGVSGIVGGLIDPKVTGHPWRWAFVLGMLSAGLVMHLLHPEVYAESSASLPVLIIAGLLVGYGTQLGNGCTSGHGVCGISRFSMRSIVATLTFMICAAITVYFVQGKGN